MTSPLIREKVVLPPTGWRKAIPARIKREVLANQNYKSALPPHVDLPQSIAGAVHFDHRPPLHERPYIEEIDDTEPRANDPKFIFAITAQEHRELSGKDWSRMCRTDRLRGLQEEIDRALTKECGHRRERKGTIKGAGFPKKKRRSRTEFGLEV
jgi:hypothetical protein